MQTFGFLTGGGEMGERTRQFDWASTPVGPPDQWPMSLRTTVSTILSSRFPMFLWWGEDLIQFYNDAYRPSLGNEGKHPTALGQKGKDCWPEIWAIIYPLILHVLTTGEATWSEDQLIPIYRNGAIDDVYWTFGYSPVRDDNGFITGVLVICTETTQKVTYLKQLTESKIELEFAITDLTLAKKKVEENEKNFRNTILGAPVAICIFKGPDFVVEIANERMFELWGKTPEEMLHKPLFEGLPEGRNQGFEEMLTNIYTYGKTHIAEELSVKLPRDGIMEQHYIDVLYEPERGVNGQVTGIIAVAILVTERLNARRKIEEVVASRTKELAEANRSLQRSNAELSQFAYIASHDLQEPVRKVSTYADILESLLTGGDTQVKNFLNKIITASQRMQTLIRDLLAYSELSQLSPAFSPVNLQAVMEDVQTEFELLIEQKGAKLQFKDLPTVDAISLQMSQVFGNLLSNALKYARADVKPVVVITAVPEGNDYHIEVRDNGIGFDQIHADQIFSIFQRLHRRTEYTGTGIGLAVCKKIVQNHNGDIYATSEPGKGATFHVILPRKHVD